MFAFIVALGPLFGLQHASAAACSPPGTDYGTATLSLAVPATATYRIWTRMQVPNTSDKTYLLEVDGATCYNVGGGSIPATTWTWVDYASGTSSNKVQQSLSQGNHTLKLIGNAPGVKVDRIVALSDLTCIPNGFGDNCNVPDDNNPPVVTLTAPTEGAKVSGTVTLSATASDNIGIAKVEFYDNSSLIGSDTSSPYSISWNSASVPNGSHLITAKVIDNAGNSSSDSSTVSVQNGDTQPPSKPSNVSAQALSYKSVKVTWNASTDNVAVTGYTVIRDGVPVADIGAVKEYTDSSGLVAATTYEYKVLAFDAAGNKSSASSPVSVKTKDVESDTQPPTQPTNLTATAVSPTQVNLAWTPSTDNTGVAGYDVYRASAKKAAQKIGTTISPSFGDTSAEPKITYTYHVVAHDGAGNASKTSNKVKVTTPIVSTSTVSLTGRIVDEKTKKSLAYARGVLINGGNRSIYQADKHGRYAVNGLTSGQYNFTFSAKGYSASTLSLKPDKTVTSKDIGLRKK